MAIRRISFSGGVLINIVSPLSIEIFIRHTLDNLLEVSLCLGLHQATSDYPVFSLCWKYKLGLIELTLNWKA